MVDKIGLFANNAYVAWNNCNKSICRLKRALAGQELKLDLKNQKTNTNELIRKYPEVFNDKDTYKLVGGKYLGEGEYTSPYANKPIIYMRPHGGEKNDNGRVIQMILKNPKTGETAQLDPTWLVAFNIAGTVKEKIETKLTTLKGLFHLNKGK